MSISTRKEQDHAQYENMSRSMSENLKHWGTNYSQAIMEIL
jgi:hypothetical protein